MEPYTFRALIARFCLRRTTESTWLGKYVINKTVARPIPFTVLPEDDEFSESADALKKSATHEGTPANHCQK